MLYMTPSIPIFSPAGFVGNYVLLARALDAIPILAWACWPTRTRLAGANSGPRCCLARYRLVHRLCAGL